MFGLKGIRTSLLIYFIKICVHVSLKVITFYLGPVVVITGTCVWVKRYKDFTFNLFH